VCQQPVQEGLLQKIRTKERAFQGRSKEEGVNEEKELSKAGGGRLAQDKKRGGERKKGEKPRRVDKE